MGKYVIRFNPEQAGKFRKNIYFSKYQSWNYMLPKLHDIHETCIFCFGAYRRIVKLFELINILFQSRIKMLLTTLTITLDPVRLD